MYFAESDTMGKRVHGYRGDWLPCLDECSETDSPELVCHVSGHSDMPRRSFEEIVPLRSLQAADLPDMFRQRSETAVQIKVVEPST